MGLITLLDAFESRKCSYGQKLESDPIEVIAIDSAFPKSKRMFACCYIQFCLSKPEAKPEKVGVSEGI